MLAKIGGLSALLLAANNSLVNASPLAVRSPADGATLFKRTLQPVGSTPSCTEFIVGQKPTGGQVCVSFTNDHLVATYPLVAGMSYNEAHLYLGLSPPTTSAPGQFQYNGYCKADGAKAATCSVPYTALPGGKDVCATRNYYIATHAALGTETGWGQGPCIDSRCRPWAMYWSFYVECAEPSQVPQIPGTKTQISQTKTQTSQTTTQTSNTKTQTSQPKTQTSETRTQTSQISQTSPTKTQTSNTKTQTSQTKTQTSQTKTTQTSEPPKQTRTPAPRVCPLGTGFGYVPGKVQTLNSFSAPANRWGWAIIVSPADLSTGLSGELYVGAGRNDISKATDAGSVSLKLSGGVITVAYHTGPEYDLGEVHIYASCSAPTTYAPGQYGFTNSLPGNADYNFEATFDRSYGNLVSCFDHGPIYFILHADVNKGYSGSGSCPAASSE
ncbi:hypothetical protein H2201_009183 [Coniosporium apollinis]|uniref:Ubiquitin 3 binding protein But2 C-terminal domain-containing protein n=1 Tax=Coniosporium apollinis TaxID=61459 RepID=A0ABQ9NGD3_9PEZI|nr:hypothetical protein H2201_009183 [Coniosporium apollinis]